MGSSYAAGMERSASVTNQLARIAVSARPQSVAGMCGSLALRCLKAVADSYVQSSAYNPYWIATYPVARSVEREARQG